MNAYPLVSVIIPVYNREDYIVEAMDSVLAEQYPNLELILIDDGSTDRSREVIEAWIEQHQAQLPTYLYSRPNKGFIPTLNELITRANGQYIVFFGSDDRLANNGIIKRFEYLRANPSKLMVVGDCTLIDGDSRQLHESAYVDIGRVDKQTLLTDHGLKKFMILNGYVPGATLMADKRIYEEFGLYDESLHAEDWVFYIRVVAYNRLGFMDTVVSDYRKHDNNMCFSNVQLTQAKEQLALSFKMIPEFKGVYRLYLLQRIMFQLLYVPYLAFKFKMLDWYNQGQQNGRTGFHATIAKAVLNSLISGKTLFMHAFGQQFERQP